MEPRLSVKGDAKMNGEAGEKVSQIKRASAREALFNLFTTFFIKTFILTIQNILLVLRNKYRYVKHSFDILARLKAFSTQGHHRMLSSALLSIACFRKKSCTLSLAFW